MFLDVYAAPGSQVLVTTPGATKFYRSTGAHALQSQRLGVEAGATLEWLPQDNIFFPGAKVRLQTRVELAHGARLALWENHSLGRPANDEGFDAGVLELELDVRLEGKPLLLEKLRVAPGTRHYSSGLRSYPVVATQLFYPANEAALTAAREEIGSRKESRAAATLLDDLLVVRYLGTSSEAARLLFIAIWENLREPLLERRPSPPRIWAT